MTDEIRKQFIYSVLALPPGDKAALGRYYGELPEDADMKVCFIVADAIPDPDRFSENNKNAMCAAFFVATLIGRTRQEVAGGRPAEAIIRDYYRDCSDSGRRTVKGLFDAKRDRELLRGLAHVIELSAKESSIDLLKLFRDVEMWFGADGNSKKITEVQRRWVNTIARK